MAKGNPNARVRVVISNEDGEVLEMFTAEKQFEENVNKVASSIRELLGFKFDIPEDDE